MKTFEDSPAWQKAKNLNLNIRHQFKDSKDYGFKDQLFRASLSIMNNIAEGFERQTQKELKQFLFIAKGSCGEVRSMLHLAIELNYLEDNEYEQLLYDTTEVSKLLSGFIKKL